MLGGGYTKEVFLQSLKHLRTKKMGMYLLHFPNPETYIDCWHDLEDLYRQGLVECIGVCNCQIHHLEKLIKNSDIPPFINQVECHPYLAQEELLSFCRENGIQLEAYSPFARNLPDMIYNPVLRDIASAHNKSVHQIILRWDFQRGIIPLPKASSIKKVQSNVNIFDFALDAAEMEAIKTLDKGFRIRFNPDTVDYNDL